MSDAANSHTGTTVFALLREPTSREGWGQFVRRYGPRVYGWCRLNGLADAEEVVQEVLVKLVRGLATFDPAKGRFTPWLRRMTRHAWLDYAEARRRSGVGLGNPDVRRMLDKVPPAGSEDALEAEYRRELLEWAVERMRSGVSARDHTISVALTFGGWTPQEVAAVYVVKSRWKGAAYA